MKKAKRKYMKKLNLNVNGKVVGTFTNNRNGNSLLLKTLTDLKSKHIEQIPAEIAELDKLTKFKDSSSWRYYTSRSKQQAMETKMKTLSAIIAEKGLVKPNLSISINHSE